MKVNVVGTAGCGKSTFGKMLAEKVGVPYIETDELFWKPNWTESSDESFFLKIEQALASDGWILDGNYNRTTALKWKQVQTVVYLDLPFHVVLFRMIKRCLMRGLTREVLWAGNTETVWRHFFTLDSMILWTVKRFHSNWRRSTALFKNPEYAHIHFVRLSSKAEVDKFLASFSRDVAIEG